MKLISKRELLQSIPSFDMPQDTIDAISFRLALLNVHEIELVKFYCQSCGNFHVTTKESSVKYCPHCGVHLKNENKYEEY